MSACGIESIISCYHLWIQQGGGDLTSLPGKSHVAIGFLRNTGTGPPRKAIGPLGSKCFSREVRSALCKILWLLKSGRTPIPTPTYFSGSAHDDYCNNRKYINRIYIKPLSKWIIPFELIQYVWNCLFCILRAIKWCISFTDYSF